MIQQYRILIALTLALSLTGSAALASIDHDGPFRPSRHLPTGDIEITFGTWSRQVSFERPLTCIEALHPKPSAKGWRRLTRLLAKPPSYEIEGASYRVSYSDSEEKDKILNLEIKWRSLRKDESLKWRIQFSSLSSWTRLRIQNLNTGRLIVLPLDQIDFERDRFAVYVGDRNQFILRISSPSREDSKIMLTAFYDLTNDALIEVPR